MTDETSFVDLAVINDHRAGRARFEVDEILWFAEQLYEQVESLAIKYVSDGDANGAG
jgi:hypothetical protein